jgi:transcriptional regulator with XRE-family HTH domain
MLSIRVALGAAVRSRRVEQGISQEKLGEIADLDRTYISSVERGIRNPTIESLWKIASGLETVPSEILADAESQMSSARPSRSRKRPSP